MKELTFETLIAVFEEMFGAWLFWGMVLVAAIITVAFIYVLIRDAGLDSRRLVRAELLAPFGAIAAILFVQWVTNSGFADIGGAIDVIVLILIGLAGAGGTLFLAYVAQAMMGARKPAEH